MTSKINELTSKDPAEPRPNIAQETASALGFHQNRLKFMQDCITRQANNTLIAKAFSIAVLIGATQVENQLHVLGFVGLLAACWVLDGFFLRAERLFRTALSDASDVGLLPSAFPQRPETSWIGCIFSKTLVIFHPAAIAAATAIALI